MRQLVLWLMAVGAVLAQVAFLPFLRPFGVVPALALVLLVLVGLEARLSLGLAMAVGVGFMVDLVSGTNFGLWTGVLVLEVLVSGLVHQAGIDATGWYVGAVLVAVGTLVLALATWVGLVSVTGHWPAAWMAQTLALQVVINWGLMLVLRPLVRWSAAERAGGL